MRFRRKRKHAEVPVNIDDAVITRTRKRVYCDGMDIEEQGEFHLKYLDGYYAENQT